MIDFGQYSQLIWTVLLAALLFWPVWRLIWVLSVRRAQARANGALPDEQTRTFLKRKAAFTSLLLCLAFAFFYTGSLLR